MFTHFQVFLEQSLISNKFKILLHLTSSNISKVCFLPVPPSLHHGDQHLLGIVDDLLAHHDHCQLLSQLYQTSSITTLLIPQTPKDVFVVSRVTYKLAFEECNVDDGGVEVDELEDEHLEGEVIIIVRLSPVHL